MVSPRVGQLATAVISETNDLSWYHIHMDIEGGNTKDTLQGHFSTSEERTTKWLAPMCPLFRGSAVLWSCRWREWHHCWLSNLRVKVQATFWGGGHRSKKATLVWWLALAPVWSVIDSQFPGGCWRLALFNNVIHRIGCDNVLTYVAGPKQKIVACCCSLLCNQRV